MKVTYNWLKDFVEIKIPAEALANKLTMAGLEVVSLEERNGDFIFEIEITSNRPDWLSVIGVAREVAAITSSKVKTQSSKVKVKGQKLKKASENLKIETEDKKDCPLYTAKIVRGVKVGPSPNWLKDRLELIGCRSVNNIVDITNYVLFETGEPLHAFDLDKLAIGEIIIRRAKKDEKITTIDAQQRALNEDILVIADREKSVAVAGVMGGKDTEVSYNTKNILLEAAIFNPIIIRRERQKLGLQTDSSYRFERGIDAETVLAASKRAAQLIQELAGGELILEKASSIVKPKKKSIILKIDSVSKILGIKIPQVKIKKILIDLGFQVKLKTKNSLNVFVPSHRQDVNLEIDLIEEIARIFGYESIPTTLPQIKPQISLCTRKDDVSRIKKILFGLGLNEVITYSLVDRASLEGFSQAEPVAIQNPLSNDQEVLRTTLAASLGKCVAYNLNQKQDYISIFEIAKIFQAKDKSAPTEELFLGIALCGEKMMLLDKGLVREEMGLLHLKGMLDVVFSRLGIKDYNFKVEASGEISVLVHGEWSGRLTQLSKNILGRLEIKNRNVVVAEIDLEKIFSQTDLKKQFKPLAVFPGISRDISLVLKEEVSAQEILDLVKEKGLPLLKEAAVVDFYKGKQIPQGFKGLTVSCLYRLDERTLTEEEITPVHSSITSLLVEKLGAQIR